MTYRGKRTLPTSLVTQATDACVVVRQQSLLYACGADRVRQDGGGVVGRFRKHSRIPRIYSDESARIGTRPTMSAHEDSGDAIEPASWSDRLCRARRTPRGDHRVQLRFS